jgi:hypothetical protein
MKTLGLLLCCTIISTISKSQDINSMIKGIHTGNQAVNFIKTHPNLHGQILDFKSFEDSSELAQLFYSARRETVLKRDPFVYKVLWDTTATYSKVSYIYLSGDVLEMKQIDSLRNDIISQYNKGTSFAQLASIYSMDGNTTGELDWFLHGNMATEFVDAINQHSKGEVFTTDVPSQKWYYVVYKTHDTRIGKQVIVLKLKNL